MLEESSRPEKSAHGQIVFEARFDLHRATRDVEDEIVQPNLVGAANAVSDFAYPRRYVDAEVPGNLSVEQAARGPAVDDCFEPFRPWRIRYRRGNLNVQHNRIDVTALSVGKYAVWNDRAQVRPRMEPRREEF